jgi:predicted RNA-binding protein Jag
MAKQVEGFKEEAQKSLRELQENIAKQVEALKQETQKSLKDLREDKTKQVEVLIEKQEDLQLQTAGHLPGEKHAPLCS